ncbi:hypothetical protein pdam_00025253 [Pocillopora damicornis]|uniref:Uncharacterized protein n=1 Tax=Pocillopora damicornis TaxID=46731 RepID=A0A3M6UF92_POCDA|nr:hypothetical protein pdam_00025253 [Pocillopora damicornis]
MAARGLFRSTKLLSYFVRSLPISVYLMYSTATVYAGDRNEKKEDDSRRHKGCFAWKRKNTIVRNLATAKKERTQVNENLPEEEKDCEPATKIKTRSQQGISKKIFDIRSFVIATYSTHLAFCGNQKKKRKEEDVTKLSRTSRNATAM